ncbi:MAG: transcription antitermination factor NusB [Gammaproteobacteria bacterium]|nr:transcription antitermination factor NusB [Rhodocyclaceae bacterium]MBU3909187.1 transcription antitermination factor NusB [Gammaproteobacteria bacterium]MBU3990001.1 transcription antitermination factor NusB [Gammaproteobacteria bacterium]MBU4005653.1 transcription antitermination factor NusB [Gammaproteobacteria bacterium]MBU4020794.1 transcription antitermination factor NusB [Gammaproteobacteria bacterium]
MSADVTAKAQRSKGGSGKPPSSPRHRAREFVVQGLYQHLVGGQDAAAIIAQSESVAGFDRVNRELYDSLLDGVLTDAAALQALLEPHIERPWAEVSPIERGILLIAACELKHHPETPYRVVINEAIELTKSYGGTDGHKFVNGVIDKLVPELRPHEIVAK